MASQRIISSSPSSGDHYNSETAGPPAGRRARGTWTATLDFVQKTLHLGATFLGTLDGLDEYTRDKRSGLLALHSASCSATLQRSRPKSQQPDLFAPRYTSMLYVCQPRALHFTSTALRAASASLGTVSAPFLVLPTSSELCPRVCILESRPWIISDQESPFAEGSIGPRANLRKEPGRSSRDILWITEAGPR